MGAAVAAAGIVPSVAFGAFEPVPGQIVVQYEHGTTAVQERAARVRAGVALEQRAADGDIAVVSTEPGTEAQALAALRARPGVRRAFRDGVTHTRVVPNDTYMGDLWGLRNTGQAVGLLDAGTPGADIGMASAWDLQTAGALTAVVDSGIPLPSPLTPGSDAFTSHPDLTSNVWVNSGDPAGAGDNDGNGYVDDRIGWDFVGNDRVPTDGNGHGTHVAGTIGARGNNGVGVAGVAWTTSLMALRTQNNVGDGTWGNMLLAFDYAGDNGARVVNASVGGTAGQDVIDAVVSIANAHPMTLYVFAAGNDGANLDTTIDAPCEAAAVATNAICVAATDNTDALPSYSNYGASVTIGAPGSSILSTWQSTVAPFSAYAYSDGTSMASPHVAGAASLVAAAAPAYSGAAIRSVLLASADARPGLGRIAGYRRLDVSAALRRLSNTTPPSSVAITSPAAGAVVNSSPLVQWTAATSATGQVTSYEVWLDGVLVGVTSAATRQWQIGPLPTGSHSVQVQAVDDAGNRSTAAATSFSLPASASPSLSTTPGPASAPNPAPATPMVLTLRGTQPVPLRAVRGNVTVPLRCSGTAREACTAAVSVRFRVKSKWTTITSTRAVSVAAGAAGTARLTLNPTGRALLRRQRSYVAQVRITPGASMGGAVTTGRVRISGS